MITKTIIIICALLAMLIATAALADDSYPPARYDHEFNGQLIVRNVSTEELYRVCNQRPSPFGRLLACSYPPGQFGMPKHRCIIFMGDASHPGIFEHERAHCNGWPANHPR